MTNKRMYLPWLVIVAAIVVAAVICGVVFLLGDAHAVQGMSVARVTPAQAARAMEEDNFYGLYRQKALVVTGTVASVSPHGSSYRVTFAQTWGTWRAFCDMAAGSAKPAVGQALSVVTVGGPAEREPHGVLMVDCTGL